MKPQYYKLLGQVWSNAYRQLDLISLMRSANIFTAFNHFDKDKNFYYRSVMEWSMDLL